MINGNKQKLKRNESYFKELKKLMRLSRNELIKFNLSDYARCIEIKYAPYHTKHGLCEDILINSGMKAYI